MLEHMQEMQFLMQQIRQEDDPERRRQLVQEHRERMQEGMEMMHKGLMGRQTNGSPGMEMSMEERMRSMQYHVAMMQMMMDHMMERERQGDETGQ